MAFSTINKSSSFMNTKLYTGTGSSNAITGVGFQPDWVWLKNIGSTSDHKTVDAVRGATKYLEPNDNQAEATTSNFVSLDSDGFTITGTDVAYNQNSETFASWNWKANGAGSANTDGSINTTSTSVNTTAGFSISKYVGTGSNATVGHGLGVAPSCIITKNLSATQSWCNGYTALGWTKNLHLNESGAVETTTDIWNDTAPTSSVFSVGTNTKTNGSGNDMIAYCFAEVTGYSKFGSYTGNGNADGTFVYTGFKPNWLMVRRTNSAEDWMMFDIKRTPYYPTSASYGGMATRVMANDTRGDDLSQGGAEWYSNGFKWTTSWAGGNGNGDTYIYMAFGQPIISNGGVCATAR